jgi:hypothetical protein
VVLRMGWIFNGALPVAIRRAGSAGLSDKENDSKDSPSSSHLIVIPALISANFGSLYMHLDRVLLTLVGTRSSR